MTSTDITVIDYGVGNLFSVERSLEHCGGKVLVTSDPETILASKKVILPGVGAFGDGMRELKSRGLDQVVKKLAQKGTPLLGICLGMQILLDESEEFGHHLGLGLIPGKVVQIPTTGKIPTKIPHIGWSPLELPQSHESWKGTILEDLKQGESAYFVHSFMASVEDPTYRIADCIYGEVAVSACIRKENVWGCQFHPEKSGQTGLKILKRFLTL